MAVKELLHRFPRPGLVEWIGLSSGRRDRIVSVGEVQVDVGTGLVGDHHAALGNGERQVTLIQSEHFDVLSRLTDREVTPEMMRRNVVVSGINLAALKRGTFRLGQATLRGTGPCHPCGRIEENLGEGGLAAALGHSGITATVLEGGTVRVGDPVLYLAEAE